MSREDAKFGIKREHYDVLLGQEPSHRGYILFGNNGPQNLVSEGVVKIGQANSFFDEFSVRDILAISNLMKNPRLTGVTFRKIEKGKIDLNNRIRAFGEAIGAKTTLKRYIDEITTGVFDYFSIIGEKDLEIFTPYSDIGGSVYESLDVFLLD